MILKKITNLVTAILVLILLTPTLIYAQDILKGSEVHGSSQADAIYYLPDSKLGISDSSLAGRLIRMNGYTEVNYSLGNFTAGLRFEAYLPPLLGYDSQNEGLGIPYWYARYKNDFIDVTAGDFYEQFGYGMMLRTYQEWTLGFDNSIRGLRVKVMPYKGITLKGLYGIQRYYWDPYKNGNRGIVKGFDGDFYLNDIFTGMADAKLKVSVGGTFVSDFQKDATRDIVINGKIYEMKMPQNVSNYGGRINLDVAGFSFFTEYAHKINDPSARNNYIYKNGNGIFSTIGYTTKGVGISVMTKWIDNMSYKSDRTVTNNMLDINYLPAITKEHTYALAAMYPYATQATGEAGIAGTVTYHLKKNSKLGGKNGMSLAANFSQVNSIKKTPVDPAVPVDQPGTKGYTTNFFSLGSDVYYQEANIEVTKKFSKKWKGIFTYLYQTYNKYIVEGHPDSKDNSMIYSQIGVADITWNITTKHSLRCELQGLWARQDKGNWAAVLLEFTIAPQWFFSIQNQYNYGNQDANMRLNYYLLSAGYNLNSTRISLSYGRQREGVICVGGVCRFVPASTGFTLTFTSSF
jgi:hypothetical protein